MKKFLSFVLCTALIAGLFIFPVSATYNVRTMDNLETGSVGAIGGSSTKYYASSSASGLLINPKVNSWCNSISIGSGMGYEGSTGLYFHCDDDNSKHGNGNYRISSIMTKGVTIPENGEVIMEYKIKIPQMVADDSNPITSLTTVTTGKILPSDYMPDSSSVIYKKFSAFNIYKDRIQDAEDATNKFNFVIGEWYTVVSKISGTGATRTLSSYILDSNRECKLSSTKTVKDLNADETETFIWPVYMTGNLRQKPTYLVADDFVLTEYTTSQQVSIDYSSIESGKSENNGSIKISFDQEISEASTDGITIYKTDDTEKTPVSFTLTDKTFNSFTIVHDVLEAGTDYTLDLSSIETPEKMGIADEDKTVSFTAIKPHVYYYEEDNFNQIAAGTSGTGFTNGNVLIKGNNEMSVEAGVGFGGTNGYRINTSGTKSSHIQAKQILWNNLGENETVIYEYKVKINSATRTRTAGNLVYMSTTNSGITNGWTSVAINEPKTESADTHISISDSDFGSKVDLPLGEWFTVVLKVKKNSATVGYVYDNNGILIKERAAANVWASGDLSVYLFAVPEQDIDAVIDDVKMYILEAESMSIKESSVTNGAEEVSVNEDIKITFDQPLSKDAAKSTGAVALYDGETKVSATVTRIGADTLLINPDNMLKGKTEYTLKMESGLNSLLSTGYNGIDEIKFTTQSAYPVELTRTSLSISNGSISSGEKTITLYNADNVFANAKIVVALYDASQPRKLIGCEIFARDIVFGENTFSIAFGKSYSGVASAEILVYDSLATMKSIMFGHSI